MQVRDKLVSSGCVRTCPNHQLSLVLVRNILVPNMLKVCLVTRSHLQAATGANTKVQTIRWVQQIQLPKLNPATVLDDGLEPS
jgi:hypothetical protein